MQLDSEALPEYPRNYDDWNEAFWSLDTLSKLRTYSGDCVMAAPPEARWPLLKQVRRRSSLPTATY